MKRHFITLISALIVYRAFAAPDISTTSQQQAILNSVTNRVLAGNSGALYDVASMPAPIAVPYLYYWTHAGGTLSNERNQVIGDVLRKVDGYADYLRSDMAQESAAGIIPEADFISLGLISTPEAAAVAAPYLFDFKTIVPPNGDILGDTNFGAALDALENMHLANAPAYSSNSPTSVVLVTWQKWAIAQGFVPKDWSSRVGAPVMLLKLEAFEKTVPGPNSANSPHHLLTAANPPSATPPTPITETPAEPTTTLSPSITPPASETTSPKSTLTIWGSVVLVLLVIGGVVVVLRKRP